MQAARTGAPEGTQAAESYAGLAQELCTAVWSDGCISAELVGDRLIVVVKACKAKDTILKMMKYTKSIGNLDDT